MKNRRSNCERTYKKEFYSGQLKDPTFNTRTKMHLNKVRFDQSIDCIVIILVAP